MSVTQSESGPQLTARSSSISGEGGIRTRGGVTPTQHFQCCTFGRSVTSPKVENSLYALSLSLVPLGQSLAKSTFGKVSGKIRGGALV
jgi:hypothetical protein